MVKLYVDYANEYTDDILEYLCNICEICDFDLMDITSTEEGADDVKVMVYFGEYAFNFTRILDLLSTIPLLNIIKKVKLYHVPMDQIKKDLYILNVHIIHQAKIILML